MCQEGGGLHVSEDRGDIRRENEKRKGEGDTSFHTMGEMGGGWNQPENLLILPTWKKVFPFTWKNSPLSRLPLPVLPNTKFLFPQASKPKASELVQAY